LGWQTFQGSNEDLGCFFVADNAFEQISTFPAVSELGKIEDGFDLLGSEVSLDDQPRDMERCIELWMRGMQGTRELKSERRFAEARNVLQMMFVAWPGEQRIKELRDLAVHW
jgi:hypothetical protein